MKLEIETAEELEAAMVAVDKLRKTQVRHVGKHAKRLNFTGGSTAREKAFADRWAKDNTPQTMNGGLSVLEHLLCVEEGGRYGRALTPEEATAAATVIQWLGTNVGWCFLEECVRACGYRLVQADATKS